jgi:amino acid adenylation domain-containing protein
MERAQRDAVFLGAIIAPVELLSDSRNWPQISYDFLFLNQFQDKPDKQAIVGNEGSLTYQELEYLSRQWAYWLLSKGIKRGDKVLVCMERTLELPAVLLGILRAGACYVPADPAFPPDRIAIIFEASDAVAVVSDKASQNLLPSINQFVRFLVEDRPSNLESRSLPAWCPEDLAYLIFTSGSTGRPKGVPITRAAMVNFLLAMAEKPGITAGDRVMALTTISFDISVLELFLPLIVGASLYLVSKQDSLDPKALSRIISDNSLTLIQATPSTWRLLHDYGWRPEKYQRLLCGGEAFPANLATEMVNSANEVWNMYGPTEATVWSSCHRVTEMDISAGQVPLGRALPNITYRVCDPSGNHVSRNESGELWIGGVALTPGYYRRHDLDAERFVVVNRAGEEQRFYRTGDIVAVRDDGELVYLDRSDNQVKVRGYRIELGEIETALRQIAGVQDAVVVKAVDNNEEPVLIGCVTPAKAPSDGVLSAKLASLLPGYMVPTVWAHMDKFPETPNRKVDRRKLREYLQSSLSQTGTQPDTVPAELKGLAKLWEQVVGSAPDRPDASFLAMGGSSLSAARLSVLVEQTYDRWIEPVMFLANPELEAHWQTIQSQIAEDSAAGARTLRDAELSPPPQSIPASSAQASMWYAGKLSGTQSIYNESEAFTVKGRLNESLLHEVLTQLQRRHIAFRMVPELSHGNLIGWRSDTSVAAIPLRVFQWTDEFVNLEAVLCNEARESFEFSASAPLIRFALHRLASGDDVIQLTAHHMIIDGLSERQLWIDLADIYSTLEAGKYFDDALPCENVFGRYLAEATPPREADISYWQSLFEQQPAYLDLKTDHPRPPEFNYKSTQAELDLGVAGYQQVSACASAMGLTPFQMLLAIFFVWLDRYSQQGDYVVGIPISGRDSGITEESIGLFMNTVPIREKPIFNESFSDFAGRLQKRTIEALSHGKLSFGELVERINPDRQGGRTPLYQSMFSYNDQRGLPSTIGEHSLGRPISVDTGYAPTELVMLADVGPDTLRLRLKGSADLFSQPTITRMVCHFRELLASAACGPETPVGCLNMSGEEEQRLISAANTTYRPYPRDSSIAHCFHSEVSRCPESIAVEFGDQRWSYRELAEQANRVSRVLKERGVQKGDPVGLIAIRHPDTIAALIGILQLGATYVPLDSGFPVKRLEQIVTQSGLRTVLVHSAGSNKKDVLPAVCDPVSIRSQPARDDTLGLPDVGPMERAYIMFTSGSTGEPKGIEVAQRNILRLVKNTDFMPLNSETRFLMNSPVPFDASTLEIWGPLLNGGTWIIPEVERATNTELERLLIDKRVNSAFFTTTLFHYIADEAAGIFGSLRYLLTGGEVLSPHFAKKVLGLNPGLKLINGYGPTENTTFTCCFCMSDPGDVLSPVPVGKPVANSRVHILDAGRRPSPIGIPGELYAGGDGIALGYVNRPDLTKERFINTDLDESGRIYRTGDLARWLADGNIEFLGRADNQVKIRGFRIEPEEVTLKVVGSPYADHAFTMSWQAPSGEQQLVCYFVRRDGAGTWNPDEAIRQLLTESLPSYMVPAHILEIEKLPQGPTGKVDKSLLPEPTTRQSISEQAADFQGQCERDLANIWKEVLGRSDFGRSDDFFMLGGSSLKALEVFSRIESTLGLNLPLAVLLKKSTISTLAEHIEALKANHLDYTDQEDHPAKWQSLVTLVNRGTEISPIVCVHAVGGNVLSYRGLRHFQDVQRSVVGFQSRGLDGQSKPQRSIEQMASDYVDELLAAGYRGTFTLMGGSMGGTIALEMAHRLKFLGMEVDWVVLLDTIGPHARHYPDYIPPAGLFKRGLHSLRARGLYYGKAAMVQLYQRTSHAMPYRLRPFWVEDFNRRALYAHLDKPYFGNVLFIRAPEGRALVYSSPKLGWEGILEGNVLTEYVDVEHDAFMESEAVQDILKTFFADIELNKTKRINDNA